MNRTIKDENNEDLILDENDYQVMMEWEKPYMEALVDNLAPFGDVLEIGFGLGYSSQKIQEYPIKSHTIIENDANTLKTCKEWAKDKKNVKIIEGSWQNKLSSLGNFDCFLFDDCPSNEYPDPLNIRIYDFIYRIFEKNVKINSKITWYSDYPTYFLCHPKISWENKVFFIEKPKKEKYTPNIKENNNKMFMPLLSFPYGKEKIDNKLFLSNTFLVGEILYSPGEKND